MVAVALTIPIEQYTADPHEFKRNFAEGMGGLLGVAAERIRVIAVVGGSLQVSFKWKNPDFLFRNPDYLIRNRDFLSKNAYFIMKNRSSSSSCRQTQKSS